MVISLH